MKRKIKPAAAARITEASRAENRQSGKPGKAGHTPLSGDVNDGQAQAEIISRGGVAVKFLWFAAVALTAWSFGYAVVGSGDLWWHLAIGRYVMAMRRLPLEDIWSFTSAGQTWLQHEWLSDVIYELWTRAFGLYSLVYWKWLVIAATFVLLFGALYRAAGNAAASYLAVLCALVVSAPFFDIRPQLYTLLGCAFLLNLLWARGGREKSRIGEAKAGKSFAPPVWLPLVFLVWVNLHGGFFFGLMLLFVLLVPIFRRAGKAERRRTAIIFAACGLICFINPNGAEVFFYPLKYALNGNSPYRIALSEWHSPFEQTGGGIVSLFYPYLIGLFALSALFLIFTRKTGPSENSPAAKANGQRAAKQPAAEIWTALALGALTLAMSMTSRRFITLFALMQSLTLTLALRRAAARYLSEIKLPRRLPPVVWPLAAMAFALFLLAPYPQREYAFHYLTAENEFPQGICEFFNRNQMRGNVLAYYSWGGFVTYCTDGRMKVYIDGRADTVYSDETLRRYSAFQNFREGWQKVLENSDAQYILFPRDATGAPLAALVTSGQWRILSEDYISVLLARRDVTGPVTGLPADSPFQNLTAGVKAAERQSYAEAEKYFDATLRQIPYERTACYGLVDAQTARGAAEEARATLERCRQIFPDAQKSAAAEARLNAR